MPRLRRVVHAPPCAHVPTSPLTPIAVGTACRWDAEEDATARRVRPPSIDEEREDVGNLT